MLKRTPLYEAHKRLSGRIVGFAGWEMPVQYSGVIDEHLAVRGACGLFDVSHMGEVEVSGKGALKAVRALMTNDIDRAIDGQCLYTLLCYPDGGVVDDCIVYRFNDERFLFCVNASNTEKAFEWIKAHSKGALVENLSPEYAQLALQGPRSVEALRGLLDIDPATIKHFHFMMGELLGSIEAIVSRTGYTGEDGFEIYLPPSDAIAVWDAIMEAGKAYGIKPIGLGARDTLRLEMGYPLYGHELSAEITPIEAGLKKYVRFGRGFIGEEVLRKQAEEGVKKTLIGFKMKDPGIPRAGYGIMMEGKTAGMVTSGTLSPSLNIGIGMGYVDGALKGAEIDVMIRNRAARAIIAKPPFYPEAKAEPYLKKAAV